VATGALIKKPGAEHNIKALMAHSGPDHATAARAAVLRNQKLLWKTDPEHRML
jgi:hypothetical protein